MLQGNSAGKWGRSLFRKSEEGRGRWPSKGILAALPVLGSILFLSVLSGMGNLSIIEGSPLLSIASWAGRDPASRPFPKTSRESDEDDILENYKTYLDFVLVVGRGVDPKNAKNLAVKYDKLRKYNPAGAARFLKGLKFEMDHRLHQRGGSVQRLHSGSPEVRSWVRRYLKDWHREADEQLFREYALRLARSNRAE